METEGKSKFSKYTNAAMIEKKIHLGRNLPRLQRLFGIYQPLGFLRVCIKLLAANPSLLV
jgi:hypothetical protein